jgi:hypothetical protein
MNKKLKKEIIELWVKILNNSIREIGKVSPIRNNYGKIETIYNTSFEDAEKDVLIMFNLAFEKSDVSSLWFEFKPNNTARIIPTIQEEGMGIIQSLVNSNFPGINEERTMTWQEAYDLLNAMIKHFIVLPPVVD